MTPSNGPPSPTATARTTTPKSASDPTLGPTDLERQARLDALRTLLAGLPADETADFQDEVDSKTNPEIGSMWMKKGQQVKVETPGNNAKRYIPGSIHWRTGQVFLTEGKAKQGRVYCRCVTSSNRQSLALGFQGVCQGGPGHDGDGALRCEPLENDVEGHGAASVECR